MSVIETLLQDADILGVIAISLIAIGFLLIFILAIFIHILHPLLSRRLDSLLFNPQWFSIGEVAMLSLWPLSLFKTSHYIFLITFPNYARRKRFKGLQENLPIEPPLKLAASILMYLHILFVVVGIAVFIFGTIIYTTEAF